MHADRPSFEDRIVAVLVGVAMRRGEAWQPIVRLAQRDTHDAAVSALHH